MADFTEVATIVLYSESSRTSRNRSGNRLRLTMAEIIRVRIDHTRIVARVINPKDCLFVIGNRLVHFNTIDHHIIGEIEVHTSVISFPDIHDGGARQWSILVALQTGATGERKVLTVSNGVWSAEDAGAASVTAAAVTSAIGDMSAAQVASVISDLSVQAIPTTETVSGSTPTIAAEDNHIYSCGELSTLTITDSAQNISFTVDFTSGATATTITVPAGYKAPGGDLTPEASKAYELNVRNGKAVLTAFEAVSAGA